MKYIIPLAVVGMVLLPAFAFASCLPPAPAADRARADVMVLGEIADVSEDSFGFAVEKYFKGSGPSTLEIQRSLRKSGDSGLVQFTTTSFEFDYVAAEGRRYLLYLSEAPNGELRVPDCSGSREVRDGLTTKEGLVFYTSFFLPSILQAILFNDVTFGFANLAFTIFILVLPFGLLFGIGYWVYRIVKKK